MTSLIRILGFIDSIWKFVNFRDQTTQLIQV